MIDPQTGQFEYSGYVARVRELTEALNDAILELPNDVEVEVSGTNVQRIDQPQGKELVHVTMKKVL